MFSRNKLEEWYEGKTSQYDISECGMVNTVNLNQTSIFRELENDNAIYEYADSKGNSDLISIISGIYNCPEENILITNGASEAIFLVLFSLINKHTKITCQLPYYSELKNFFGLAKCDVKLFRLDSKSNFRFDFEQFKSVFSSDSNVAILNFPNNPTGSELSDRDYADIINYSENNQKIVIFDEVAALSINGTYIEKHIQYHFHNCICINSMSKAYGVPGIRVGWIVASKAIIKECQAVKEFVSISTPLLFQKIAINLLQNRDYIIRSNKKIVEKNITLLKQHIGHYNFPFVINSIPKNCMCCLIEGTDIVNDYEFCKKLYEECDVLLAPGKCFGLEGYFRLGLGIDSSIFDIALTRIEGFINKYCAI